MPSTDHKLRVFLCHASPDKPVIRELYQRLLTEGWIDPWLDEEKLLPGQDWDYEIEKAVETTDTVIVFLSKNSVTKDGYVQRELKFALDIALEKPENTIFVIPLRLDNCLVPRRLKAWQYVDYFPAETKNKSFQRLLESLIKRFSELRSRDERIETWNLTVKIPGSDGSFDDVTVAVSPQTTLNAIILELKKLGYLSQDLSYRGSVHLSLPLNQELEEPLYFSPSSVIEIRRSFDFLRFLKKKSKKSGHEYS